MSPLHASARRAMESVCSEVKDAEPKDSVDGISIQVVAIPHSTEEISDVMKAAAAHRLVVVGRGSGTKMTWGRAPESADVVVDLSMVNRVLDHAAGDLVVVTEAGTRLEEVQRVVASSRQRLAIDETMLGASIGGTIATATSGPLRLSLGSVRDLLIGVTVVRADGVVAKAGGRVVKNVAGYDLCKLMTGSYGTLALITEAIFRLHPIPSARSFVTATVENVDQVHSVLQAVMHSQVVPGALEVEWPPEGVGTLTVMIEGSEAGVLSRASTITAFLNGFVKTTIMSSALHEFGTYPWPLVAAGEDRATALKMTCTLSGVPQILTAARQVGVPVHIRGSAGAGVLYGAIPSTVDAGKVVQTVQTLRKVSRQNGGSTVVLDASKIIKSLLDTWGPVPAIELMKAVKQQFDPERHLAPGRFVGGI